MVNTWWIHPNPSKSIQIHRPCFLPMDFFISRYFSDLHLPTACTLGWPQRDHAHGAVLFGRVVVARKMKLKKTVGAHGLSWFAQSFFEFRFVCFFCLCHSSTHPHGVCAAGWILHSAIFALSLSVWKRSGGLRRKIGTREGQVLFSLGYKL